MDMLVDFRSYLSKFQGEGPERIGGHGYIELDEAVLEHSSKSNLGFSAKGSVWEGRNQGQVKLASSLALSSGLTLAMNQS